MQKKLLAVAVAGALTAPAVAMAQSAVTVSGNINIWYEVQAGATGATNKCPATGCTTVSTYDVKNRDRIQDGNGSNIRFTAVEDIGSGMQAFAQVESAVINNANTRNDAVGTPAQATTGLQTAGGWATRNSGVGLRGQSWGEVLIGVWDVHYNEQYGTDGLLIKGASHNSMLGLFNSFGMAGTTSGAGALGGAAIGGRYSNVIRYQSPNWGGFSFRASYARPTDGAVPTTTAVAPANNVTEGTKNKVINFAPQFNMGGIHVGFSYLKDSDIVTGVSTWYSGAVVTNQTGAAAGATGPVLGNTVGSAVSNLSTITSSRLFGAYSFPFGLKLGLVIDQSKLDMKSSGTNFGSSQFKRTVWGIPVVYTIGAHTIAASYAQASKLTGSIGQNNGATSVGLSDVGVTASGAAAGSAPQAIGDNSKAKMYVLGYTYDLSKRTNIHVSYSQIKNDNLAGYDFFANGVGLGNTNFGADPRIINLGLRHAF
jgi:predicted porin